jgi:hypothetical protein
MSCFLRGVEQSWCKGVEGNACGILHDGEYRHRPPGHGVLIGKNPAEDPPGLRSQYSAYCGAATYDLWCWSTAGEVSRSARHHPASMISRICFFARCKTVVAFVTASPSASAILCMDSPSHGHQHRRALPVLQPRDHGVHRSCGLPLLDCAVLISEVGVDRLARPVLLLLGLRRSSPRARRRHASGATARRPFWGRPSSSTSKTG